MLHYSITCKGDFLCYFYTISYYKQKSLILDIIWLTFLHCYYCLSKNILFMNMLKFLLYLFLLTGQFCDRNTAAFSLFLSCSRVDMYDLMHSTGTVFDLLCLSTYETSIP
jgi:hypothetical protein